MVFLLIGILFCFLWIVQKPEEISEKLDKLPKSKEPQGLDDEV